eukprot:365029-Chlamydomonas_euryale.AAC.5
MIVTWCQKVWKLLCLEKPAYFSSNFSYSSSYSSSNSNSERAHACMHAFGQGQQSGMHRGRDKADRIVCLFVWQGGVDLGSVTFFAACGRAKPWVGRAGDGRGWGRGATRGLAMRPLPSYRPAGRAWSRRPRRPR